MLNSFPKLFPRAQKPQHDSCALSILSPGGYFETIHIVPEDPTIIEQVGVSSPRFPRSVTIQSRISLGELAVRITEGQSFTDATQQLRDLIEKAYNDDVETGGNLKSEGGMARDMGNDANSNETLSQCERALRQGFSAMLACQQTPVAAPQMYTVDLVRISRSKPGRIWDDSTLTSFPH